MDANLIIAIVFGCVALFVALKIGHFILKILFGLIALLVLGGAVWWLLLRLRH
jgi:hypothetical protein